MIEVESRAVLSSPQRDMVLERMRAFGPVDVVARVVVDFSGADRKRTVALRLNNGDMQLVAKTGGLTDTVRTEAKLGLADRTTLVEALSYLSVMGYTNGMLSLRRMFVTQHGGLEYSVRDVLRPDGLEVASTLLDVEALDVKPGDENAAIAKVHDAFTELSLQPLTPEQWAEWVDTIYRDVDRPFENTPQNAASLAKTLVGFSVG